jgi:hypothetical protein
MKLKIHTVLSVFDELTNKHVLEESVAVIETNGVAAIYETVFQNDPSARVHKDITTIEIMTGTQITVPYTIDEVLSILAQADEHEAQEDEVDKIIKDLTKNN